VHELAVTRSLLETAERHAREAGALRVTRLRLVIGEFASIVDDSISFYWDIIAKGTLCEGSSLEFRRVPARLGCLDCSREYLLEGELVPCPDCRSERVRILGGDEFRLESIDVETAHAPNTERSSGT
jgi:hydrogenase nickel incorporation protein HypA/HybF